MMKQISLNKTMRTKKQNSKQRAESNKKFTMQEIVIYLILNKKGWRKKYILSPILTEGLGVIRIFLNHERL